LILSIGGGDKKAKDAAAGAEDGFMIPFGSGILFQRIWDPAGHSHPVGINQQHKQSSLVSGWLSVFCRQLVMQCVRCFKSGISKATRRTGFGAQKDRRLTLRRLRRKELLWAP
jgi:hypothetical protein